MIERGHGRVKKSRKRRKCRQRWNNSTRQSSRLRARPAQDADRLPVGDANLWLPDPPLGTSADSDPVVGAYVPAEELIDPSLRSSSSAYAHSIFLLLWFTSKSRRRECAWRRKASYHVQVTVDSHCLLFLVNRHVHNMEVDAHIDRIGSVPKAETSSSITAMPSNGRIPLAGPVSWCWRSFQRFPSPRLFGAPCTFCYRVLKKFQATVRQQGNNAL